MTLQELRATYLDYLAPRPPTMLDSRRAELDAFEKDMPILFAKLLKIAEKAVPYRNFAVALTGGGALDHAFLDLEADPG